MPKARAISAGEQKTAYLLLCGAGSTRIDDDEDRTTDASAWIGGDVIRHISPAIAAFFDVRSEYVFDRKVNYIPLMAGVSF